MPLLLAVILLGIFLVGAIIFGVVQIVESRRVLKTIDEAKEARGWKTLSKHLQTIGEETIKRIQKDGEETRRAI